MLLIKLDLSNKNFWKILLASVLLSLSLSSFSWVKSSQYQNTLTLTPATPRSILRLLPFSTSQNSPKTSASPSGNTNQKSKSKTNKKNAKEEVPWLGLGAFLLLVSFSYGLVRWRKPIWLLGPWLPSEITIPKFGLFPGMRVPLWLIQKLKYTPRVLDAWIDKRIQTSQEQFENKKTVIYRSNYVPLPILFNGLFFNEVSTITEQLKLIFDQPKGEIRLLIWGEGGIGKTSLACQIAKWAMVSQPDKRICKHRMIPILIESELKPSETLITKISRQVKNLSKDEHPPSEELLEQLLLKRRLLVIVDHLSEMDKASWEKVRLSDPNSPVNALVVTSRSEDILGIGEAVVKLQPQRLKRGKLLSFMDTYLGEKRDYFNDEEYIDDFKRLSRIVSDQRDVTVLFATLFLKQMVAKVEKSLKEERLPDNVPELMLEYLRGLNRHITETKLTDDDLIQSATRVAWFCLEETFQPRSASRTAVLDELAKQATVEDPKKVAEAQLNYLENRLSLIRTTGGSIQFELDPLAEYLAGWWVVNDYAEHSNKWEAILKKIKELPGNHGNIRDFLLALRECCLVQRNIGIVPNFVPDTLAKLAALDVDTIKREQFERRVRRLKNDLDVPEEGDRLRAIEELGKVAFKSKVVVLILADALGNSSVEVKLKAVDTLGSLDWDIQEVIHGLLNLLNDENAEVKQHATEALANLGECSEPVIHLLLELLKSNNPDVRQNAAAALGNLGVDSEPVIQGLLDRLDDFDFRVREDAAAALGNLGVDSEPVIQGLLNLLKNSDRKEKVALALGKLGVDSEPVIQGLLNLLDYPYEDFRQKAARALIKLDKVSDYVIHIQLKLLTDENQYHRQYATAALGNLGVDSEPVIQGLLDRLTDDVPEVRLFTAEALVKLDKETEPAIQELLDLFTVDVPYVRHYAAEVLVKLGDPAIKFLLNALRSHRFLIRMGSVQVLGQIDHSSENIKTSLVAARQDRNTYVRQASKEALVKLNQI